MKQQNAAESPLPAPARYFPVERGRYEVAPRLHWIAQSFGNGAADARLFQFDSEFPRFRANKLACRAERLDKYVLACDFSPALAESVARLLAMRLVVEYPDLFTLGMGDNGAGVLQCHLTGEVLIFGSGMALEAGAERPAVTPFYANAFDALCSQVSEDIAVIHAPPGETDRIVALHLCAPSHWSGEEKIGKSFIATHDDVPGFEKIARASGPLLETLVQRGPFVRFNWGIEFTDRLNQHTEPPLIALADWNPRHLALNASEEPFYLRVERQVLWGLPDVDAFVFAIRIYHTPARELRADTSKRAALANALRTMPDATRTYKDLAATADAIADWLGD